MKCDLVGLSPDSVESHQKFIARQNLKVELLADPDKKVLEKYGIWQKKKLYGREYMGVVRSTFLIDPKGKLAFVWEKVKVNGHAEAVLEKLKELA